MKKILAIAMVVAAAIALTSNVYAVPTPQTQATQATVTVGEVFSLALDPAGPDVRSTTEFSFKTVDGSMTKGWYWNTAATYNSVTELPDDNKADVLLRARSNYIKGYKVAIRQSSANFDTKNAIGYFVEKAFDSSKPEGSNEIPGVIIKGSGFYPDVEHASDAWGEITTSDKNIINITSAEYATLGVVIPINFALVPAHLSSDDDATTTITYTMTPNP